MESRMPLQGARPVWRGGDARPAQTGVRSLPYYNAGLQERREAYRMCGASVGYLQQQNQLPAIKEARPEYKQIGSQVLQDVLRRWTRRSPHSSGASGKGAPSPATPDSRAGIGTTR